jgi:two-component system response regulator HydG
VPPLREWPEDVELIARYLLAKIGGRAGRAVQLSPDTLAALERYEWPGNVRELENALEYAVALGRGQTVQLEDLPAEIRSADRPLWAGPAVGVRAPEAHPGFGPAFTAQPVDPEETPIRAALERNLWNRSKAAADLGMSRTKLWRRMRELRIGIR